MSAFTQSRMTRRVSPSLKPSHKVMKGWAATESQIAKPGSYTLQNSDGRGLRLGNRTAVCQSSLYSCVLLCLGSLHGQSVTRAVVEMNLLYQYIELESNGDLTWPCSAPASGAQLVGMGSRWREWEASTGGILIGIVAEDHFSTMERKAKIERCITVELLGHKMVCATPHSMLRGLQKLPL